ncbi:MAG: arylamine N-acetyltransferase, partial [Planctomycetales bacterium]|nr:arylamine N-acetyltransferase [Planctomycetales bacterium]
DVAAIHDKIVEQRRGGYCFEQNTLLAAMLELIGFQVHQLSGRVWIGTPAGDVPPLTHVFLCVVIDGVRWLIDCGVGGATPTAPIQIDKFDTAQETPHEARRIVKRNNGLITSFMHQADYGGWTDVYEFTGELMPAIDKELGHWYTSRNPQSKFLANLIVSLARRDGTRIQLHNREFIHRRSGEVLERIEVGSRSELAELLGERFQLELPAACRLDMIDWG